MVPQTYLTLLDDEDHTLESLKIQDEQQLVIEGTERESLLSVPGLDKWISQFILGQIKFYSLKKKKKHQPSTQFECVCYICIKSLLCLVTQMYLCASTVRNKDMSWPEEMSFIANSSKMDRHKGEQQQVVIFNSYYIRVPSREATSFPIVFQTSSDLIVGDCVQIKSLRKNRTHLFASLFCL